MKRCVIQPNWTPNPPQSGHAVQPKLDTHSTLHILGKTIVYLIWKLPQHYGAA
jgi:hypothetical protein